MPLTTALHDQLTDAEAFDKQLMLEHVLEGMALLLTNSATETTKLIQALSRDLFKMVLGVDPTVPSKLWSAKRRSMFYQTIEALIDVNGRLAARSLRAIAPHLPIQSHLTPTLHMLVSVINGVMGDHLISQQNPMALPMVMYDRFGMRHNQQQVKSEVVIFVHGLCMSHYGWRLGTPQSVGEQYLQANPNASIYYLTYNSGRRISQNGLSFANLLNTFCQQNPHVTRIHLVGHSMGGLVSRSALFYAKQKAYPFMDKVKSLLCLGSPHHGAALERLGYLLQSKVGNLPVAHTLAHLGDIRSAGILDLRFGSVRHDDWEHMANRVGDFDDNRKPAPLPKNVNCHMLAATLQGSADSKNMVGKAVGDYLVTVPNALGIHSNPDLHLKVDPANQKVFYGMHHNALLYHPAVIAEVIARLLASNPSTMEGTAPSEAHADTALKVTASA